MTNNEIARIQKPMRVSHSAAAMESNPAQTGLAVPADEVARRAYFCYVNQGSRPGHDVQHWLEAEAQLVAERKLARGQGFYDRT